MGREYKEKVNEIMQGKNLDAYLYDCDNRVRAALADMRYSLKELADDKDRKVKVAVVRNCDRNNEEERRILDKMSHDDDWYVRVAVVQKGYALETLVYDPDVNVRLAVARKGFGLDILAEDEEDEVRCEVAKQCDFRFYKHREILDKLIYDRYWAVRGIIAKRHYALGRLVNDDNFIVRLIVAYMCDPANPYHMRLVEILAEDENELVSTAASKKRGLICATAGQKPHYC